MLSIDPLSLDGDMLDEAKAYLRLETGDDDAPLGAIILAAIGHAENFTRTVLLRRGVRQTLSAASGWQRLGALPVTAIGTVTGIPAEGASFPLVPANYQTEIDRHGTGHVRVLGPGAAGRVEVAYQAGLAEHWAQLPEAIRLGILRLVAHHHAHRDAGDDAGPPAAVAALLRPWRRMKLV